MFDLEQALSTWRDSFKHNRKLLPKDLDELERHLRDQVDALTQEGNSQEFAFRKALEDAGIGVEVMKTDSACRTYNVLVSEGRRVAAALLPVSG